MQSTIGTKIDVISQSLEKIYVYVTLKCNLTCSHCFVDASPSRDEFISLQRVQSLLENIPTCVDEINITGGEPLLHKELVDICNACSLRCSLLTISTNGTLLTPKHVKQLKPYVDRFNVSLDGRKKDHDCLRGYGTYTKAMESIELLVANDIQVNINTVINDYNCEYVMEWAKIMYSEYPVEDLTLIPMVNMGRGYSNFNNVGRRDYHCYNSNSCEGCDQQKSISIHPSGRLIKCHFHF